MKKKLNEYHYSDTNSNSNNDGCNSQREPSKIENNKQGLNNILQKKCDDANQGESYDARQQASQHSHSHGGHTHVQQISNRNEKVVLFGFLVTVLFMIVEFVGGYISGSLALTADAGHMLVDSTALLLSWLAFYFGKKPSNARKTFGYSRLEIVASLINSLFLFGLTIIIIFEAFERFFKPVEVMAMPMLIVSVLGLIINCVVFYALNRGETEHLNIKSAMLHVLGDLLGSVAAIVAAIVIYFVGWSPIDSILSVFVCLLILHNVWNLFKESLNILMEGVPSGIDVKKIEAHLFEFSNIKSIHRIHIWSITSGKHVAMLEISVKNEAKTEETLHFIKEELADDFNIYHSTIEISNNN
jgi:cobalt-zinc-cadmium efflux system protein